MLFSIPFAVRCWLITAFALIVAFIAFSHAGFVLAVEFKRTLVIPAVSAVIGRVLARGIGLPRSIGLMFESVAHFTFVGVFGLLLSVAATVHNRPLFDANLLAADRAMGYDWRAMLLFCAGHPTMAAMLRAAYFSIWWQVLLIAALLSLKKNALELNKLALAMVVGLMITTAIFTFFPATSAWTFEDQDAFVRQVLPGVPTRECSWITDLMTMRAGGEKVIYSTAAVIAFPSYHCISAILYAWYSRHLRYFNIVSIVLNAMMIASALVYGGHYLSDLVAGAVVAVIAIWAVERMASIHTDKDDAVAPARGAAGPVDVGMIITA